MVLPRRDSAVYKTSNDLHCMNNVDITCTRREDASVFGVMILEYGDIRTNPVYTKQGKAGRNVD